MLKIGDDMLYYLYGGRIYWSQAAPFADDLINENENESISTANTWINRLMGGYDSIDWL